MKLFLILGSSLMILAVAVGAFGAHALKNVLEQTGKQEVFETASKYHFYHALGLILLAVVMQRNPELTLWTYAGWAFVFGVLIFSGSLYVYSVSLNTFFAKITPIGGLGFLVGWVCFLIAAFKSF